MSHLRIERLAELADGDPTATEREHLASCAMCASELEAYGRLVAMAGDERRRIAPPLTSWRSLSGALRDEGLITTARVVEKPAQSRRWIVVRRAAAALFLLGGGTVVGRLSTGLPVSQAFALGAAPLAGMSVEGGMSRDQFVSTTDAMQVLQRAQREYERAALYLATHDTSTTEHAPDLYRARLAALDEMAEASLRMLEQAPADPIMNQVYLTTLGAREMTLSRLGTTLPANSRLTRF